MTHIIPVGTKVLVKFTKLDRAVILPDDVGDPQPDIRVLAVGSSLTDLSSVYYNVCKPGDKIITRPDINIQCLKVVGRSSYCLIDASGIVAIDLGEGVSLEA